MATIPEEPTNGSLLRYRVTELERGYQRIERKLDSMQGRVTALLLTIAASAITFALTVLAGTGRL